MKKRGEILWLPCRERMEKSQMASFMKQVRAHYPAEKIEGWDTLYHWSITQREEFWDFLQNFVKIKWIQKPKQIYQAEAASKMRGGKWFSGGKLNYADNLLSFGSEIALYSLNEEGLKEKLTKSELKEKAYTLAQSFLKIGIKPYDRVAAVTANSSEALLSLLATSLVGGTFSSCSPDFGVQAICDRFQQIQPKALIFSSTYSYNGKAHSCLEKIKEVLKQLPSVENVIQIGSKPLEGFIDFQTLLCVQETNSDFCPYPLDFNDPLFILFSSGTTGVPKCIVHGVGGTLLQHKKEQMLHLDMGPSDRAFFYSTCGWMMWNWLISALSIGSSIVLYDGSLMFKDPHFLWHMIDKYEITHAGMSPKYIASLMALNSYPRHVASLESLKVLMSTGAPLSPDHFEFVYKAIKTDIHLASISGGTDIISCFMLANPLLPVRCGEIQSFGLGMSVKCLDEEKREVKEEKGELVCTAPFVSMPISFWNDPDGAKYKAAYFEYYGEPEIWRHGDFIEITESGGVVVHGRSDATLNPKGVRIGTAELYQIVESLAQVKDSIAVSYDFGHGDVEIVLFIVLKPAVCFSLSLVDLIKNQIRQGLSPRHVPFVICEVNELPYTRSGKKMETLVKAIINKEKLANLESVANPECLEVFKRFDHQKGSVSLLY